MLVGFLATCKMFTQHTHTQPQLGSDWLKRRPQPNFMAKNGALLSSLSLSPSVTTSASHRVPMLLCCIVTSFCFAPPFPAAAAPPLTNLQRLTYLTCWHALNRMSDDDDGDDGHAGRHCSKARNTLRQFAAAKRADDGEWRRMTVGT